MGVPLDALALAQRHPTTVCDWATELHPGDSSFRKPRGMEGWEGQLYANKMQIKIWGSEVPLQAL